jgi:hypothetical protein
MPITAARSSCTEIKDSVALMMEAASASETLVNFYKTARRNNPEDSHIIFY